MFEDWLHPKLQGLESEQGLPTQKEHPFVINDPLLPVPPQMQHLHYKGQNRAEVSGSYGMKSFLPMSSGVLAKLVSEPSPRPLNLGMFLDIVLF